MSNIKCGNETISTFGDLPKIGTKAPDFILTDKDFNEKELSKDYEGCALIINVYPSLDTNVCFDSMQVLGKDFANDEIKIIGVSMDTPFALQRISKTLSFDNIDLLSDIRNRFFGAGYGITIVDGFLGGLLSRAVFLLDSDHNLRYCELAPDVAKPLDYAKLKQELSGI